MNDFNRSFISKIDCMKFIPTKNIIDYRDTGRAVFEKKCQYCANIFYPIRKDAKFCSVSCRTRSAREAIKAAKGGIIVKRVESVKSVEVVIPPGKPVDIQNISYKEGAIIENIPTVPGPVTLVQKHTPPAPNYNGYLIQIVIFKRLQHFGENYSKELDNFEKEHHIFYLKAFNRGSFIDIDSRYIKEWTDNSGNKHEGGHLPDIL